MNDRGTKGRDFASAIKNYTEVQTADRPPIKLGAKNRAKLDRIRRLAAQLRGK